MRYEVWRTILAAYRDIDNLVASAVGDYPASEPPQTAEERAQRAWQSQSSGQAPADSPVAGANLSTWQEPASVQESGQGSGRGSGQGQAWPRPGTPSPVTPTGTRRYPGLWPGEESAAPVAAVNTPRAPSTDQTARFWAAPAGSRRASTGTGATTSAVALAQEPEPAPEIPESDQAVLDGLERDVLARITQLEDGLAMEAGYEHVVRALVFYFDEYILARLPDYLRLGWTLLQLERYGINTGGEDFFKQIGRLENLGNTPSLVFEVHYFCLSNGFQGQYADDINEIENWKKRLRTRIPVPERRESGPASSQRISVEVIRSPVWYYLGAVALVVLFTVLLTALSN